MISAGQLQEILGCTAELAAEYAPHINKHTPAYGIDTPKRLAMWVAQVGHESARLSRLSENLNYSSEGLLATWPTRFSNTIARALARNPEAIANHVYGGRLGNTREGDGWKYRGRGLIQLTGYSNYRAYQTHSGDPVTVRPDLLERPEYAVKVACWYWQVSRLNAFADTGDILGCSALINTGRSTTARSGVHGIEDREELYQKALTVLGWS